MLRIWKIKQFAATFSKHINIREWFNQEYKQKRSLRQVQKKTPLQLQRSLSNLLILIYS